MTETPIASPQMPDSLPDTRTLGSRLAAYAFLANDPSVPMVAADWWEISGPHYNAVAGALAHFVAGEPAAEDLRRFAASPGTVSWRPPWPARSSPCWSVHPPTARASRS